MLIDLASRRKKVEPVADVAYLFLSDDVPIITEHDMSMHNMLLFNEDDIKFWKVTFPGSPKVFILHATADDITALEASGVVANVAYFCGPVD